MLQNAYFLAKIGADTAENEQHFAEICQKLATTPRVLRRPGYPDASPAGSERPDVSDVAFETRTFLSKFLEDSVIYFEYARISEARLAGHVRNTAWWRKGLQIGINNWRQEFEAQLAGQVPPFLRARSGWSAVELSARCRFLHPPKNLPRSPVPLPALSHSYTV